MTDLKPKIIVIMPAYNAEKTLRLTYADLPKDKVDMIILTDDASTDKTVEIAKELGLKVFLHARNLGYGANQKTCYREALKEGADIVAMVHPDYQYDPTLLPELIKPIINNEADVVLGSRMLSGDAVIRGMPRWKYIGNRILTLLENITLKRRLSEYHTGYRVFSKAVLESIAFDKNSNGYVFDQEILFQIHERGFRIKEVPVPARYLPESSSANFLDSVLYGLGIIILIIRYKLHKLGIIRSSLFV
jgi:glycosyltransferase involved in cell wall biosynthesis